MEDALNRMITIIDDNAIAITQLQFLGYLGDSHQ
jgi:hypothetical protein